jgi:hypothetical protein
VQSKHRTGKQRQEPQDPLEGKPQKIPTMTNFQRLSIPDSFNLRTISKSKDNSETICYIFPLLPPLTSLHLGETAKFRHHSGFVQGYSERGDE